MSPGSYNYLKATRINKCSLCVQVSGEDSYDKRYDVATVIRQLHELAGLPIYSGMPFGHIGKKYSFPLGATCQLSPNANGGYQLAFTDYPTIKADAIQVEGLWQTA